MKRTLYLNENESGIHLRIDGPSLVVEVPYEAQRRIPINLLGRMVIFGNILVDSDVLTFLAENNIPVIFISKWARSFNIALSANYAMIQKHQKLDPLLKDRERTLRFLDWALEERAFLQRRVIEKICNYKDINSGDYCEVISFFMPYDKAKWRIVKRLVRILFWSLIIEELINKELNPHNGVIHRKSAFGLVKDYAYIMASETDLQALQFFRSDSIDHLIEPSCGAFLLTARGIQNIINRFENRQYISKDIIQNITDKLFELIG